MKIKEIRKKDEKDLEKLLGEQRKALVDFRFGIAGSKVKNLKEAQETRRTIARILTILGATKEHPKEESAKA